VGSLCQTQPTPQISLVRNKLHIAFDAHSFYLPSYLLILFSCSLVKSPTMKLGPSAEVVFGTTQPVKKAKIDDVPPTTTTTTVNGVQGTTANQQGWTKVEKRMKKKEVKVDWKRDVRFAFFVFVTQGPVHHASCR